jgi:hypothetical protein
MWFYPDDGHLTVDNCVQAGGALIGCPYRPLTKTASPEIRVTNSTVRAEAVFTEFFDPTQIPVKPEAGARLDVAVFQSVIDVNEALRLQGTDEIHRAGFVKVAESIDAVLPQLLAWKERQNLYAEDSLASFVSVHANEIMRPSSLRTLTDWDKAWAQEKTGSSTGRVRYQAGDPLAVQVKPDDFRLRADSAGYKAGPDGKNLGADVDLVGPGAAYERWKQTPEYQQWLKETEQESK